MRTIVVPTDCSALSREALRYADRIADRTSATVVAVYGTAFSARLEGEGVAGSLASRQDLESMVMPIRSCVEDTIRQSLSDATQHDVVIDDCQPADAIISVANKRDADLIIMGTHDRNRLTRAVLGSVTDSVLHHTRRPVLILREHSNVATRPIRRILCPHRQTAPSAAAIREAKKLAELLGAELTLYDLAEDRTDVARKILLRAEDNHADLIVIGTSHRRFSDPSEIGRPASEIVRMAYCPVLTVCG